MLVGELQRVESLAIFIEPAQATLLCYLDVFHDCSTKCHAMPHDTSRNLNGWRIGARSLPSKRFDKTPRDPGHRCPRSVCQKASVPLVQVSLKTFHPWICTFWAPRIRGLRHSRRIQVRRSPSFSDRTHLPMEASIVVDSDDEAERCAEAEASGKRGCIWMVPILVASSSETRSTRARSFRVCKAWCVV